MLHVDLTQEEREILSEVLDTTLGNLSYEISDTDTAAFKEQLRKKRATLQKLRDAIASAEED